MVRLRTLLLLGMAVMTVGCSSGKPRPIPPAPQVDLQRFMGDWYVIAHIPSFPEREAFDAVETYALRPDGKIQTTFTYRKGSFDAPIKTMHPVGTVVDGTRNAIWGMQFIWPIKAEYVIVDVGQDYQQTIVGRSKRDYVWLMARTPSISEGDYALQVEKISNLGYDVSKLRRVPQRPLGER